VISGIDFDDDFYLGGLPRLDLVGLRRARFDHPVRRPRHRARAQTGDQYNQQ
jgi:hypothetical protein